MAKSILIGWDKDVLCFIEVKTRTARDVKPAEAAVDREKRRAIRIVVRDYLRLLPERQFPEPPPWRFDVITVYYEKKAPLKPTSGLSRPISQKNGPLDQRNGRIHPTFELFQNASLSS